MRTIKQGTTSTWIVFLLCGLNLFSSAQHLQSASTWAADSQPEIQLVPPGDLPPGGKFYQLSGFQLLRSGLAPFPAFIWDPQYPVYALGDNVFLVDDLQGASSHDAELAAALVTVAGRREQVETLQLVREFGLEAMEGEEFGEMEGPLSSFSSDQLSLEFVLKTNATARFVVHPPQAEMGNSFDLHLTTNLSVSVPGLNAANWERVLRSEAGQRDLVVTNLTAVAGTVHSGVTQGIFLEIKDTLSSKEKVLYCFLCTNQPSARIFIPKSDFFCSMQLQDRRGSNVPPTRVGESFGKRFFELTEFSSGKIERVPARGSNPEHPKFLRLSPGGCESQELPAIEELFQLSEPGKYVLRCQFQVFEQMRNGTNFTYSLIRLPEVAVTVVKK